MKPAVQILLPLRANKPFKLLGRRTIDIAIPAPKKHRLKHGADGLSGRATLADDPARKRFPVSSRHAAKAKILQNLGAMPTGCSPAKIITGQFVGWDADLLGQVFGTIVRDQYAILSEETAGAEKL